MIHLNKERILIHHDEENEFMEIFIGPASNTTYTESIGSGVYVTRDMRTNEIKSIRIRGLTI